MQPQDSTDNSKPISQEQYAQHLTVEITSVYERYQDIKSYHQALIYPSRPLQHHSRPPRYTWRVREPIAGDRLEISPHDLSDIHQYMLKQVGLGFAVTTKGLFDYVAGAILEQSADFSLDLSKHLSVVAFGRDPLFDCAIVRVAGIAKSAMWEMREPIFSDWMQCDQGVYDAILEYLESEAWVVCDAVEISDFVKSQIIK